MRSHILNHTRAARAHILWLVAVCPFFFHAVEASVFCLGTACGSLSVLEEGSLLTSPRLFTHSFNKSSFFSHTRTVCTALATSLEARRAAAPLLARAAPAPPPSLPWCILVWRQISGGRRVFGVRVAPSPLAAAAYTQSLSLSQHHHHTKAQAFCLFVCLWVSGLLVFVILGAAG